MFTNIETMYICNPSRIFCMRLCGCAARSTLYIYADGLMMCLRDLCGHRQHKKYAACALVKSNTGARGEEIISQVHRFAVVVECGRTQHIYIIYFARAVMLMCLYMICGPNI